MNLTITSAVPAHLDAWVALRAELWPTEDPENVRKEAVAYFSETPGFIANSRHHVLLAVDGDSARDVVGFLDMSVHERAAHIEAWYVRPSLRGQGLGRALMLEAITLASEARCVRLTSDTQPREYPGSAPAHLAMGFGMDTAAPTEPGEVRFRLDLGRSRS